MSFYFVFAAGFIAGKLLGPRESPLAATILGALTIFAVLQLGISIP